MVLAAAGRSCFRGAFMKDIVADQSLIGCCGLYCAACGRYLKGKCPGCKANDKATWCGVRKCCHAKAIKSCADCFEIPDPDDCKKFHNIISKLFSLIFHSDRGACIRSIRKLTPEGYAYEMNRKKLHAIKK